MMQNYEIYFIVNPELSAEDINSHVASIEQVLQADLKAENVKTETEGLKKLAYPIRKHTTGFYTLITFDLSLENTTSLASLERKLNLNENVMRYLILNQTDYLKQKSKEEIKQTEVTNHRDLNKGSKKKKCVSRHLGLRELDYKDIDYLDQFTSPYAKIFHRSKTGTSAKFQRKVSQAIKRARHMALMPFTPRYGN